MTSETSPLHCIVYHVIKLTELLGHSLMQFLSLTHHCYTIRILNNI